MLTDVPQSPLFVIATAFVAGWVVAKLSAWLGNKFTATERDPRDDRIRSLTADVRVAQSMAEKLKTGLDEKTRELADMKTTLDARSDHVHQQDTIVQTLRADLKESVLKTRELRAELSDRATENLKSEVQLREVQTELSVARASTDLLAAGMLDYSTPEDDDEPASRAARR